MERVRDTRVKSHSEVKDMIRKMKDGRPERVIEAEKALIQIGVLSKSGKTKRKIVSWE